MDVSLAALLTYLRHLPSGEKTVELLRTIDTGLCDFDYGVETQQTDNNVIRSNFEKMIT